MSASRVVPKTNILAGSGRRLNAGERKVLPPCSARRSARAVLEAYLASDVDPRRAGVGVNAASRRRVAWWGKRKCGRDGERPEIARRVCLPVRTVVVAFACRGSRHAPVRSASTTRVGSLHCTRHISPSPSRSRASRSRASSHARTAFACCEQREFKSLGAFRERAARVFVTGRTAKHFSR